MDTYAYIKILRDFCEVSGQNVSVTKSHMLLSKNIASQFVPQSLVRLDLHCTCDIGSYLGMPLLFGCGGQHSYAHILDKVRSWLGTWQLKFLSLAARYLLIQSVVSSMPTYAMQTVLLPRGLIDEIDKLTRRFFSEIPTIPVTFIGVRGI